MLSLMPMPLWALHRRRVQRGWSRPIGYFSCLGLGFMFVEIAMLQRFTLLLSYPIYSLAVTLAALLIFSGCGSLLTSRLLSASHRSRPGGIFMGLGAMAALYAWLFSPLSEWALPFALPIRIALCVLLLLPLGLLLGVPFPMGIRRLGLRQGDLIPWAWASNGAASVLGSSLAMLIALHLGFTAVLLFGAICYLLAWLLFRSWTPGEEGR